MSLTKSNLELFDRILNLAIHLEASDVHIKSGTPPFLRVSGRLEPSGVEAISTEAILAFIEENLYGLSKKIWQNEGQIDFSYSFSHSSKKGRFRVNAFYQRGTPTLVFRFVKDTPPTFEELDYSGKVIPDLCCCHDGIILLCGPTGTGKSSMLAAMINHINEHFEKHVITLEDPIEFSYEDNKSIINQREIGVDAPSFASSLRGALRQDPDIILLGEMRDQETFQTALDAAETGHLVFSSLHAADAQQAVQRLIEFFPEKDRLNKCRQIANALKATITQALLPALEGIGRIPVREFFIMDSLALSILSKGELEKIPQLIESSKSIGSQSFNDDLYRLIKNGKIKKKDALAFSPNAKALEMSLKGIYLSTGQIIQ